MATATKEKKEELKEATVNAEDSDLLKKLMGYADDEEREKEKEKTGEGGSEEGETDESKGEDIGDAPEESMPPIPKRKVAPQPAKKAVPKKKDDDDDDEAPAKDDDEEEEAVHARSSEPDYEKIAEAAGRGVARVMAEKKPAEAKPTHQKDALDDLPSEFASKKELYRHLVALKPSKYSVGGIVGEIKRYKEAEAKYRKEWEEEHEGETFNASAEDHAEFYNRHEPSVDTDDLDAAKASLIRSQVKADLDKEYSEKFRKVEQRERAGEVVQQAEGIWATMLGDVVSELTGQEKPDISQQALNKLGESDPVIADAMMTILPASRRQIHLACGILSGVVDYDDSNREHSAIASKVEAIEKELDTKPVSETSYERGGKVVRYINTDGYGKLTPAQKADYWTLDPQYVGRYLASEARDRTIEAKNSAEQRFEKTAKARGYAIGSSQNGHSKIANGNSQSADGEERAPLLRGRKERSGPTRGDRKVEDKPSEGIERFLSNIGAL